MKVERLGYDVYTFLSGCGYMSCHIGVLSLPSYETSKSKFYKLFSIIWNSLGFLL
jgi:hypothetical protein